MSQRFRDICYFSLVFLIIYQIIKFYLSSKMILNQSTILIKNFLNVTYVRNTGAAFSLFRDRTWLLIIIGIIAVIGLMIYINKLGDLNDYDMFSYSLLLGGILGNLIDRIIHGYVIDYISLNIFGYHFPVFNFADVCIVVGVGLILISMIKGDLWRE